MKVLVFDTETTGLPPKNKTDAWPSIVQLSYMVYDTDAQKVLLLNDNIVKCPISIPTESANIHGITDTISQEKGIPLAEIMPVFLQAVEDADLIVAHNLFFDQDIVMVECGRLEMNCQMLLRKATYCTMKNNIHRCALARQNNTGRTYFKFPTLAELHHHLFQVWPDGMHNAKADVLICLRCYLKVHDLADSAILYPELYNSYIDNTPIIKQVLKLQEGCIF